MSEVWHAFLSNLIIDVVGSCTICTPTVHRCGGLWHGLRDRARADRGLYARQHPLRCLNKQLGVISWRLFKQGGALLSYVSCKGA